MLLERFPAAFTGRGERRPLKIGIDADLIALGVPRRTVTTALHWYCDHYRYLIAMQPGAVRIDALGQPAGIVTEDEAAIAQQRLAEKLKPQFKSPQLAAPTLAA